MRERGRIKKPERNEGNARSFCNSGGKKVAFESAKEWPFDLQKKRQNGKKTKETSSCLQAKNARHHPHPCEETCPRNAAPGRKKKKSPSKMEGKASKAGGRALLESLAVKGDIKKRVFLSRRCGEKSRIVREGRRKGGRDYLESSRKEGVGRSAERGGEI